MINMQSLVRKIANSGIQFVNLTQEFTRFRQRLETEMDKPLHEVEVNAAEFLSDLVIFLDVGVSRHDAILGQSTVDYLSHLIETRISLSERQLCYLCLPADEVTGGHKSVL